MNVAISSPGVFWIFVFWIFGSGSSIACFPVVQRFWVRKTPRPDNLVIKSMQMETLSNGIFPRTSLNSSIGTLCPHTNNCKHQNDTFQLGIISFALSNLSELKLKVVWILFKMWIQQGESFEVSVDCGQNKWWRSFFGVSSWVQTGELKSKMKIFHKEKQNDFLPKVQNNLQKIWLSFCRGHLDHVEPSVLALHVRHRGDDVVHLELLLPYLSRKSVDCKVFRWTL